nr:hypothetical protein [Pandoravirus massiliensis]
MRRCVIACVFVCVCTCADGCIGASWVVVTSAAVCAIVPKTTNGKKLEGTFILCALCPIRHIAPDRTPDSPTPHSLYQSKRSIFPFFFLGFVFGERARVGAWRILFSVPQDCLCLFGNRAPFTYSSEKNSLGAPTTKKQQPQKTLGEHRSFFAGPLFTPEMDVGSASRGAGAIDLALLFRNHHVEAALVLSRLCVSDIVRLAWSSRAVGLSMPQCMLRAVKLGLLPQRNHWITRLRVDGVPFTWPCPDDATESRSSPASPTKGYVPKDRTGSACDDISRLVRWTAAVRKAGAHSHKRVHACVRSVAYVDTPWSSKGNPNWWLSQPKHERVAERERLADKAIKHIKASVRDYAVRLRTAARTRSQPDIAHLRADTAQMIYESALYTRFARKHLRNHVEMDDESALFCGIGPPLRTRCAQDYARSFFYNTVGHIVDLLIDRPPPPGAVGHADRIIHAALALVERWCPRTAFVDRVGDLTCVAAISPDGPEHDVHTDKWTTTDSDGSRRKVFKNSLRVHLRKRIAAYAPYLCPGLTRLCVAVSVVVRACRMDDHAVVTAAATVFAPDMEPRAVAQTLDQALSQDSCTPGPWRPCRTRRHAQSQGRARRCHQRGHHCSAPGARTGSRCISRRGLSRCAAARVPTRRASPWRGRGRCDAHRVDAEAAT